MSDGSLPPFFFDGEYPVRVVIIDGEPWFVAADVCRALGLSNPTEAVRGLEEDEKRISTADTKRGTREVIVVAESALYALPFKSRKEEAARFRRWVTKEVLPSIRRTGVYVQPGAVILRKPCTDWSSEEWRIKLSEINTAYRVFNKATAAWLWEHEGLPMPPPHLLPGWFQATLIG